MIKNNRQHPGVCTDEFRDRLVVISGATSGIGYLTARKFASQGARLLCINRNEKKSADLKAELEKEFGVSCKYIIADLSVLADVRRAAEELQRLDSPIDVLIHNAGVYLTRRELTAEGFDKVFVVQHLASFIINILLSEKLKSQERARIILVNSEGHRFAAWGLRLDDLNWEKRRYSGLKSYGSAKLAQLLSMLLFDEHFRSTGVNINAMHPGAVRSETGQENGAIYRWVKRHFYDKILRPTEISSESIYYLAVSNDLEGVSGKFFNLTTEEEPAPPALDREAAYEVWAKSVEMAKVPDILIKS
ncbi:MAG: SDR family NAD(P)-dependent oxidoreductase [Bacteroidales bacterium]|nr:SDR family NAD(P)-dependent oxidoreductase [Bacteroidales bacterium]